MKTPPLGDAYIPFVAFNFSSSPGFVHYLLIDDTGSISAAGGSIFPTYVVTTTSPVSDGTLVTVTFAWNCSAPIDNGHFIKMRFDDGTPTTVVTDFPWDPIPLESLLIGDVNTVAPAVDYPAWIGRLQWSGRTDVF
jgi:hypothetical protein